MKQQSLFPTPLWIDRFNDADQLSRWVQRVMVLRAADPIGVQLTNQGAWHSQANLLQDPGRHELFGWIAAQVHAARSHPNSLFGGVFCLAVPAGIGAIAFLDPRTAAIGVENGFAAALSSLALA
jgi:hypothetical protein